MRTLLRIGAVAVMTGVGACMPQPANATRSHKIGGDLNIVAWEGYTDPSFVKPFEAKTGCALHVAYAGSSDEMFTKMRSGGGTIYDLVSASGDLSLRLVHSGVVQAVDVAKIPNWKNLNPALKSPPHNTVNGKHYGVSFMWGPDVLIYSKKVFKSPPASWSVLYDKKYKGKITVPDNPIQLADVAVYLGYKKPYALSSAQLAKVKSVAQAQRPLVRKYWGSAGDFTSLFKNGEAVLGAGWPLMTVQLQQAGVSVGETIPREGATGWADTWMLSAHSRHTPCAYAWMNYALSPQVQKQVVAVTQYTPANLKTGPLLGAKLANQLHVTDRSFFSRIKFWQTPSNYAQWQTDWNEVKG